MGFVEGGLVNLSLESFWSNGAAQDSVLAVGEIRLEEILADGEANDETLPRKQRTVQLLGESLRMVSLLRTQRLGQRQTHLQQIHDGGLRVWS